MITDDSLDEIERIALAAKEGDGKYGQISRQDYDELPARTGEGDQFWTSYVDGGSEGPLVTAITGNGPTSEANALLFACARSAILALVDEVRRLKKWPGPNKVA